MKPISILKKKVMNEARFAHLTKWAIDRSSPLGNDWSHLPNSYAKYKVATIEDAVRMHRQDFLNMLKDYQNPIHREKLVYIRRIYDSMMKGDTIGLVCHCAISHDGHTTSNNCHGFIVRELLEVLRDYYASNGFTYCVEHLRARYYGTQPSMKDAIINDMRTGRM